MSRIRELLEAGVHFGHQTRFWNPKMRSYVFAARDGLHVIDLNQTQQMLGSACAFIAECAAKKLNIVFVGTKKTAAEVIETEARRCGAAYVNKRWLGGTITNFETVRLRINKLRELEQLRDSGELFRRPKKEQAQLNRELTKLERFVGGLKDMRGKPDVVFVVDPMHESIAIAEAAKLRIPIIALADTNADPAAINYLIPGNDDSLRSVKLITATIADAIIDAGAGEGGEYSGAMVPRNPAPGGQPPIAAMTMLDEPSESH